LHPQGIVPEAGSLIWDEATILADTMGNTGRYLFLIIGVATLFSTQVTLTDGVARSMADIFKTNFQFAQKAPVATWYARVAIFVILFGTIVTAIMEYLGVSELGFLFNAAYMGGFAMAIYTPLCLWMNLRHLPRSARPGPLNIVMVSLASLVYIGFAIFCLTDEIRSIIDRLINL